MLSIHAHQISLHAHVLLCCLLLTTQDELMLQMLYDPRLTPGMTAAEAAPIARVIAKELMAKETDI